jgi:hypothetical protein
MKATIFTLALIAVTSAKALPITFTGLCDTGVTTGCATETPLASNTTDGNFTVTMSPVGTPPFAAATIATPVSTYFTSGGNLIGTSSADWITTKFDGTDTQNTGTFNYQEIIQANVTGMVTITGSWGVDNCGTIAWGSTPVAVTGTGTTIGNGVGANCASSESTFGALTAFSFQESVVAGNHYDLDFEVGNTGGPTALLVDNLAATGGGSAAPEPSTVLLMLPGLAFMAGMIHRRRAR